TAVSAALVAACLLSFTACAGAEGRKASYLAKGQEYLAAQNYEKARLEFRNALQLDPNDAEASYLAGQAAEKLANMREAASMYQTAIQNNDKHIGARAALAKLYVFGGAPDKAMELVEPGLAIKPDDADLLTARGAARLQTGDKVGARADAEKAAGLAPDNESAIALLASIYRTEGENDKAIDLVKKAVESPKATTDLHLVLAQLYLSDDKHAEAVAVVRKVIAKEPDKLVYRYRLAQLLLLDKDVDAAEAELRAAVKQAPKDAEAKLVLANLLASQRSYEVAEAELKRLSAESRDDYALRLGLAQFYGQHKQNDEAEATLKQIIQDDGTNPSGLTARNRLAAGYLGAGNLDAAAPLLDQVLKKNPRDNEALASRANLYLAQGKADAAITDLRAVQRDQPNSALLQRALARAYLQNEDVTLAEETLRATVQGNPSDADARMELIQLLLRTNRVDAALPMLEKLAAEKPDNISILEALVSAQLEKKDYRAARRAASLMIAAKPQQPNGNYMLGVIELADDKPDAARESLERATVLAPDAVEPIAALVRLDLAQKKVPAALARLAAVITKFPQNPLAHNLKGEVLAGLKRNDEAVASFRNAIQVAPTWPNAYRSLAGTYFAGGKPDEGIAALMEGITATQGTPLLVADLASTYERLGKFDDAIAQYDALVNLPGNTDAAASSLAMLLVTHRTDKTSLDRARTLAERFSASKSAPLLDTWGWVLYKRGENAAAVTALQKAVDKLPQAPVLQYHLGMAQYKAGNKEGARTSLEAALKGDNDYAGKDEAFKTLAQIKGG
ncbi:MAG: tetratricopeptide repeat protein, partial [Steroidobacteraceae bacterium]